VTFPKGPHIKLQKRIAALLQATGGGYGEAVIECRFACWKRWICVG
jgi:hypothetical protein